MVDTTTAHTFEEFCDRTLPKERWTHEAHLAVCWAAFQTRDERAAVDFLRDAICSYNDATGVENTPTSGYHETLTRYYVHAVAALGADTIDDVLSAPECRRDAPLRHWSRSRLFGRRARAGWVEPDLCPLPHAA